ncbi:type II secretion system minor pseudopilin GspH [Catenovulum sediminis]|uniref:Type II secretion system protein H n=1 Tax=Catenovulum sediminis TaxID=1740262 RepID=A0ABV1RI16_9ALTE|nr:type II secretion system minor pseudopilin GspH [Catenovulum sediminis]
MRSQYTLNKRKQTGFTLLEVMLVMVLMAVILSSVSLSFDIRSDYDKTKDEAKRFQAAFQLAADFGLLNNLQLGLLVEKTSYQFLVFNGEQWQAIEEDKVFSTYELPEYFELTLTQGEMAWLDDYQEEEGLFNQADEEDEDDKKKKLIPQVYLFSSGEITPFSLQISYEVPFSGEDNIIFEVTGEDTTPLKVVDPRAPDETI